MTQAEMIWLDGCIQALKDALTLSDLADVAENLELLRDCYVDKVDEAFHERAAVARIGYRVDN
jgi:hypothetical protein